MKRLLSLSLTILFVVSPAYSQELGEIGVVGSSVHPPGDFHTLNHGLSRHGSATGARRIE